MYLSFLCLCFFSLSARKKGDSACVCVWVLIKELLSLLFVAAVLLLLLVAA